jgi:hypothetical protein
MITFFYFLNFPCFLVVLSFYFLYHHFVLVEYVFFCLEIDLFLLNRHQLSVSLAL